MAVDDAASADYVRELLQVDPRSGMMLHDGARAARSS
jgi:hypothetical protein